LFAEHRKHLFLRSEDSSMLTSKARLACTTLVLSLLGIAASGCGGDTESEAPARNWEPVTTISTGLYGVDLEFADGQVWIAGADGTAIAVDARSGGLSDKRIDIGKTTEFAVADDALWVINSRDGKPIVRKLSAQSGEELGTVSVESEIVDLVSGDGSVWVVGRDGSVTKIDAESGDVSEPPSRITGTPASSSLQRDSAAVVAFESVWITTFESTVVKVDASNGKPTGSPATLPGEPVQITSDSSSIWTGNSDATVSRVDPDNGQLVAGPYRVMPQAKSFDLAVGEDLFWVVHPPPNQNLPPGQIPRIVTRFNVDTGAAVGEPIQIGIGGSGAIFAEGALWANTGGGVVRVQP